MVWLSCTDGLTTKFSKLGGLSTLVSWASRRGSRITPVGEEEAEEKKNEAAAEEEEKKTTEVAEVSHL